MARQSGGQEEGILNQECIRFYSTRERPNGCFSNFSPHGFELEGAYWPTSEHYFQAQKFLAAEDQEAVRLAPTPKEAARRGRDRSRRLRPDWDQVKDDVMRAALRRKFATHADIRSVLLATGEAKLVEATADDYYWGCGSDGSGRNMLGKLLMELRDSLR